MQPESFIGDSGILSSIFIKHAPVAFAMFDNQMRYLAASARWISDFNLSEADILGKSHYDVFPDIPDRWKEIHQRGLAGEVIREDDDLFSRIDGSELRLRWEVRPWLHTDGHIGGIIIFYEEITSRRQAEKDQARLAAIVESSEDAIISKSLDGTIATWNKSAQRIFGYSPEEAIGQSILMIVPEERVAEESAILARLACGERIEQYETVRLKKDGTRIYVSLTISPIRNVNGDIVGASKIARDVTAQKHARDALHERELLLRSATDNAAVGLVMLNRDRQYIFVNAAYPRLLHLAFNADELIGRTPAEVLPDVYGLQIASRLDAAFSGEAMTFEFTRDFSNQGSQSINHFLVVYDPLHDDSGTVDRVIVTICDITQRKTSEYQLRDTKERLEFALESSQIGAWDLDLQSNKAAFRSSMHHRIFGYEEPPIAWNYASFLDHVFPADRDRVTDIFHRSLATKSDWNFQCQIQRADNQIRWVAIAGRPIFNEAGSPIRMIGIVQDITTNKQETEHLRKLESQIQHAQKLESLGVLAGGIAHDFNNILTSILGYIDLAQNELPAHSTARAYIQEAAKGACRAADLTNQMLAYSGRGKFVVQSLNLNDLIEDMIPLLQVSISKKCVLKLHLMPNLPSIEADAVQLRQIAMNLVINASDAIGERSGVIAITTGVMHCDRSYLAETYLDEELKEGPYVFLEVADSGCGMSEAIRSRIFDPFFTTKAAGRGLGLAAVLGIVRGHHGAIKIYSEMDRGTTFKVAIPAIDLPAHLGLNSISSPETWRGTGTVMVVDDEDSVRSLFQCMLESVGLTVVAAKDGRDGLEKFREQSDSIDLVILDMTMPHLDGPQTFREMRRIRANVKAILTSGYNEQTAIDQFAGKGLAGFLQKPFRFEELVSIVRKVFEA